MIPGSARRPAEGARRCGGSSLLLSAGQAVPAGSERQRRRQVGSESAPLPARAAGAWPGCCGPRIGKGADSERECRQPRGRTGPAPPACAGFGSDTPELATSPGRMSRSRCCSLSAPCSRTQLPASPPHPLHTFILFSLLLTCLIEHCMFLAGNNGNTGGVGVEELGTEQPSWTQRTRLFYSATSEQEPRKAGLGGVRFKLARDGERNSHLGLNESVIGPWGPASRRQREAKCPTPGSGPEPIDCPSPLEWASHLVVRK